MVRCQSRSPVDRKQCEHQRGHIAREPHAAGAWEWGSVHRRRPPGIGPDHEAVLDLIRHVRAEMTRLWQEGVRLP